MEAIYKVNSDPLIYADVIKWLQEHGVRIGAYVFGRTKSMVLRPYTMIAIQR